MEAEVLHKKKMFAPKLRFKGFDGDWSKKHLNDIVEKVNSGKTPLGGNSVYVDEGILFIRSQNVLDSKLSYENSTFITKEVNDTMKNSIVKPYDILLNITGASLGRSCVVPKEFTVGNVNQHVCIIRLTKENEPYFFQPIFASEKGQKLFVSLQTGSGREGLNFQSIKKISLQIPPLPEQQKIASFLSAVDEKIQQLTRKKELLEQYKKGVMQQLFSGKLRFKDENGKAFPKWEKKELNDLCVFVRSGGTPQSTKKEFYNGDIPFLSISDMTSQGKYLKYTSNHISKLGLDNSASWIVPANSIIYSMYASVGFVAINKIPIATSQAVLNLILKKEVDTEFTYYTLVDFQKKVSRFITTGTQGNLNAQTVKGFKIKLPCFEEQKKIAHYLSNIDSKIEIVNKQITQTQTFKKGLLQQMFV